MIAASVKAGEQHGLFGPEELTRLKALERDNPSLLASIQSKTALEPPGYLRANEREVLAKKRAAAATSMSNGQLPGDSVLRAMKNYPQELHRRHRARASPALRALDVAPSSFLIDKLGDDLALPFRDDDDERQVEGPKSTPKSGVTKRAAMSKRLGIRMDASVTVTRNVPLPALVVRLDVVKTGKEAPDGAIEPSSDCRGTWATSSGTSSAQSDDPNTSPPKKTLLSYSASAPVLPNRTDQERANIERKMKIYEGIALRGPSDKRPEQPQHKLSPASNGTLASSASSSSLMSPPRTQPLVSVVSMPLDGASANVFGLHYTVKQVMQFGALVTRFDEDFSGDLDQQEWVNLIKSSGPLFGRADIDKLFRTMDRDDSGKISLREILPAVVSLRSRGQLPCIRGINIGVFVFLSVARLVLESNARAAPEDAPADTDTHSSQMTPRRSTQILK